MKGRVLALKVSLTGDEFCEVTVITRDVRAVSNLELGDELSVLPTVVRYRRSENSGTGEHISQQSHDASPSGNS